MSNNDEELIDGIPASIRRFIWTEDDMKQMVQQAETDSHRSSNGEAAAEDDGQTEQRLDLLPPNSSEKR